jgi:hypothetical protein
MSILGNNIALLWVQNVLQGQQHPLHFNFAVRPDAVYVTPAVEACLRVAGAVAMPVVWSVSNSISLKLHPANFAENRRLFKSA